MEKTTLVDEKIIADFMNYRRAYSFRTMFIKMKAINAQTVIFSNKRTQALYEIISQVYPDARLESKEILTSDYFDHPTSLQGKTIIILTDTIVYGNTLFKQYAIAKQNNANRVIPSVAIPCTEFPFSELRDSIPNLEWKEFNSELRAVRFFSSANISELRLAEIALFSLCSINSAEQEAREAFKDLLLSPEEIMAYTCLHALYICEKYSGNQKSVATFFALRDEFYEEIKAWINEHFGYNFDKNKFSDYYFRVLDNVSLERLHYEMLKLTPIAEKQITINGEFDRRVKELEYESLITGSGVNIESGLSGFLNNKNALLNFVVGLYERKAGEIKFKRVKPEK